MGNFLALIIVLLVGTTAFGQGVVKSSQLERQNAAIEQERDQQEQSIRVTLSTAAGSILKPKQHFKVGERVNILVNMTNTGTELVGVATTSQYFEHRLHLTRDGQVEPYSKKANDKLQAEGDSPTIGVRVIETALPPNQPTTVTVIHLSDWYEPLALGKYELTMQHRLTKKWLPQGSNTVKFEIVP
ncbi:MAG: hypothetical protein ACR2LC_07825 [Pyrinomonadaceae bacterium]